MRVAMLNAPEPIATVAFEEGYQSWSHPYPGGSEGKEDGMEERDALMALIGDMIDARKRDGTVIDADNLADAITSRFPDCGLADEEIRRLVKQEAVKREAGVLSGGTTGEV